MCSETLQKLDAIDFTNLDLNKPGTCAWNSVKTRVRQSLEEYGCFEASFDKIPYELRKGMIDALEELFNLPLQTKLRNSSNKPFHGYIGQSPSVPLYECMTIDDVPTSQSIQSFTNLLWSDGNHNFCEIIQSMSEQLCELDQMVRRIVLESFGIEKYAEEHIDSTRYILRLMKYEGPRTSEAKLGLREHSDKNVVTILYQNEVEGLQIRTKDGEWIDIKPSPHSFIVMIGDSFCALTNGRVQAPYHRVLMRGSAARYCFGLFSVPKGGYIIKAPEELVDEDHPLMFKPFDYVDFLAFYHTEAGRKDPSALRTYCNVSTLNSQLATHPRP